MVKVCLIFFSQPKPQTEENGNLICWELLKSSDQMIGNIKNT